MGLYDRPYYQDEPQRSFVNFSGSGRTMIFYLVVVNVGIYLADFLLGGRLSDVMAVTSDTLYQPWMWWQLLTYGFAHSPDNAFHLMVNTPPVSF